MSLQAFFNKPMDESQAPKRGDLENKGGGSPPKRPKGGDAPRDAQRTTGKGGQQGRGRGRGSGKGDPQGSSPSIQSQDRGGRQRDPLVSALAKLVIRHDEQLLALSCDVTFISYMKTDEHSILPLLHAEKKRLQSDMSSIAPKTALTLRMFRELKDRLIAVSKDRDMQSQLIRDGTLNSEGEWPFLEWSTSDQTMVETLEEPLNTSQVVSGLGDIIARISTDPDHVTLFRASRPITETMSGGPVRLQLQFSARSSSSEVVESLQSLVGNSAFTLINCDFQKQGLQPSPLVRQIRDLI